MDLDKKRNLDKCEKVLRNLMADTSNSTNQFMMMYSKCLDYDLTKDEALELIDKLRKGNADGSIKSSSINNKKIQEYFNG